MSSHSESVSLADWISTRTPAAPSRLRGMLLDLVSDESCTPEELPSNLLLIAAEMFGKLEDSRESAFHLLAADALITYAMEAAAEFGVESASGDAMKALGSVISG